MADMTFTAGIDYRGYQRDLKRMEDNTERSVRSIEQLFKLDLAIRGINTAMRLVNKSIAEYGTQFDQIAGKAQKDDFGQDFLNGLGFGWQSVTVAMGAYFDKLKREQRATSSAMQQILDAAFTQGRPGLGTMLYGGDMASPVLDGIDNTANIGKEARERKQRSQEVASLRRVQQLLLETQRNVADQTANDLDKALSDITAKYARMREQIEGAGLSANETAASMARLAEIENTERSNAQNNFRMKMEADLARERKQQEEDVAREQEKRLSESARVRERVMDLQYQAEKDLNGETFELEKKRIQHVMELEQKAIRENAYLSGEEKAEALIQIAQAESMQIQALAARFQTQTPRIGATQLGGGLYGGGGGYNLSQNVFATRDPALQAQQQSAASLRTISQDVRNIARNGVGATFQ
jgi:hypothetical protein